MTNKLLDEIGRINSKMNPEKQKKRESELKDEDVADFLKGMFTK